MTWHRSDSRNQTWYARGVDWPVHWMLVEGVHAFDYRTKENLDNQQCGPYWSKGWQEGKREYTVPPISFAHDAKTETLWLRLDDARNPNTLDIDVNSDDLDGTTLVQKDLGAYWNQQEIVTISQAPPVHPVKLWYGGTPENPRRLRKIDFPKICGIVVDIAGDHVTLDGLRIHPTEQRRSLPSQHLLRRRSLLPQRLWGERLRE